jgi:hypothetical protein
MSYDFDDPQVRQLIITTHFPVEIVDPASTRTPPALTIVCGRCENPWPCPTTVDYRAWLATHSSRLSSGGGGNRDGTTAGGRAQETAQVEGRTFPPVTVTPS